ncbi:hypothetical protein ACOMHN_026592 [Nucella lapillus]
MGEVEDICKKIHNMKGVTGLLILNLEGIPIKTTMEKEETCHLVYLIRSLIDDTVRCIKDLDPTNELTFIRLHSKKNEIMCAIDGQYGYAMVVVQRKDRSQEKMC